MEKNIEIVARAILEKEKYDGQLSPQTIKKLEKIAKKLYSDI